MATSKAKITVREHSSPCPVCGKIRTFTYRWPSELKKFIKNRCRHCAGVAATVDSTAWEAEIRLQAVTDLISGKHRGYSSRAERQAAAIRLLATGMSVKKVAAHLGITTVLVYRYKKLERQANE